MISKIDLKFLKKIPYILVLLRYGINDKEYRVLNLTKMASELGVTPQNLSKIINTLEKNGLIEKISKGQLLIKLTAKALELINFTIDSLRNYLGNLSSIKLIGEVISGLGEGSYYMSLEGYVKQFIEKLGFKPYPGTLNVRLRREYIKYRLYLEQLPGIYIHGFTDKGRTYGGVKCFKANVKNIESAVLLIERTHHGPDVIEVIAPVRLRDVLGLKDGDTIEIIVNI